MIIALISSLFTRRAYQWQPSITIPNSHIGAILGLYGRN